MIIDVDTRAYQFAMPFVFLGERFEAGSWLVIWRPEHPHDCARMALNDKDFAEYQRGLIHVEVA